MIEKLTESTLQQLKRVELQILQTVLEVIKSLNLQYFAVGGTALGAVKYGGFIPWDDDIDIAMPREDYEVFKKEGQKLLPSHYFLQCHETDKEFFLDMVKIRDKRTIFIENSTANFNIVNGVFIDIFPIDGNGNKSKFKQSIMYKLRSAKIFKLFNSTERPSFKGKIINGLAKLLLRNESLSKCYQKNSMIHSKQPLTGSKFCYCRTQVIKSSYFNDATTIKFEGINILLPKEYDSYLKDCFGNYKMDIPDNKKVSHHFCLCCLIPKDKEQ